MGTTLTFLRENPAVGVIVIGLAIVSLVFAVSAVLMIREGASLKPLAFMAGALGLVAGPQIAFHLAQALGYIPKRELTWTFGKDRVPAGFTDRDEALTAEGGRFTNPDSVFGPGVDHDLVTDLRKAGGDSPFSNADVAQMAIIPPGSTAIVARYADAAAASRAQDRYMAMAAGRSFPLGSDGAQSFTRPQGDVVKVLTAGRTLLVLTGPDEASVATRLRSSTIIAPRQTSLLTPTDTRASDFWLYRPMVLVSIVVVLLIVTTFYFFRASAWAATIPARKDVFARPASELRERLLSVNSIDVPFTVDEREDGRIAVAWRFADAKWVDFARAHGMRKTHRIVLELDDNTKTVYPTEQFSYVNWSAGVDGASMRWSTGMGITFFQVEYQRVFGLQMDERGRFVPKLSYSYTFNLQEMKAPLISAVTESGWRWRPTIWQGPQWLRWLTH